MDAYLLEYAEKIIKRWDEADARRHLRGCVEDWREHYGDVIADRLERGVKAIFEQRKPK